MLNTLGKLLQESGKAVKYRALRFSQTKRNTYYEKESENIIYLFDGLDEVYKYKAFIPLDSLSLDLKTGKYYYDLTEEEMEQFAVEDGVLLFFEKILAESEE